MLQRELDEASQIAKEAGDILMKIYATDFDVAFKSEKNPVTEADTLANEFIVTQLRKLFPDDGVVAEETSDQSDAKRMGRCWYVDPLDGTKEFIKKNGEFSVMMGLTIDGKATLGVVYQPAKDKLYRGVVGHGATLSVAGDRRELRVSDVTPASALKLVCSRSHRAKSIDMVVNRLGISDEMVSGSVGLKVGLIAERTADVYVHITDKSMAWDAAGPEAVLKAAGGRFTRLDGTEYLYDGEDLRTHGGILSCNAASFDEVLPVARAVSEEIGFLAT